MSQETVVLHKFSRGDRSVKICPFCDVENATSRQVCFICGRNLSDAFVANDYSETVVRGPYPDPRPEDITPSKKTNGYGKIKPIKPLEEKSVPEEKSSDGSKVLWGIIAVIVIIILIAVFASGCTASVEGFEGMPVEDIVYADAYTEIACEDTEAGIEADGIYECPETLVNNISA